MFLLEAALELGSPKQRRDHSGLLSSYPQAPRGQMRHTHSQLSFIPVHSLLRGFDSSERKGQPLFSAPPHPSLAAFSSAAMPVSFVLIGKQAGQPQQSSFSGEFRPR